MLNIKCSENFYETIEKQMALAVSPGLSKLLIACMCMYMCEHRHVHDNTNARIQ